MYSTRTLNFNDNPGYCVSNTYTGEDKLPGEFCYGNDDCRSKSCISGLCKGYAQSESCISPDDCDIGLACSSQSNGFCTT